MQQMCMLELLSYCTIPKKISLHKTLSNVKTSDIFVNWNRNWNENYEFSFYINENYFQNENEIEIKIKMFKTK